MIRDFSHNRRSKIKIKKDYKRREFVNPYFETKKRNPVEFNTKLYLKTIAAVFLVYLIIYSDLFKIKAIEINGTDMIDRQEFSQTVEKHLSTRRFFLLPQRNLLLLSKKGLARKINESYKLNKLEIDRSWGKLRINIEEKINYLIVHNNEKFFFSDADGAITREITTDEAVGYWNRFPIFNTMPAVNIGDQVLSRDRVEFILKLNEEIKKTPVDYQGFESGGESEVTLVAKVGWRAYFDVKSDIKKSIDNLLLILNEKIDNQKTLEYIDLRFGNKVFYK